MRRVNTASAFRLFITTKNVVNSMSVKKQNNQNQNITQNILYNF